MTPAMKAYLDLIRQADALIARRMMGTPEWEAVLGRVDGALFAMTAEERRDLFGLLGVGGLPHTL